MGVSGRAANYLIGSKNAVYERYVSSVIQEVVAWEEPIG